MKSETAADVDVIEVPVGTEFALEIRFKNRPASDMWYIVGMFIVDTSDNKRTTYKFHDRTGVNVVLTLFRDAIEYAELREVKT